MGVKKALEEIYVKAKRYNESTEEKNRGTQSGI